MQAIGGNQQRAGHIAPNAVAAFDDGSHAIGIVLPVAHHALAELHGIGSQALFHGIEQQICS
jgi:hypothetical protein